MKICQKGYLGYVPGTDVQIIYKLTGKHKPTLKNYCTVENVIIDWVSYKVAWFMDIMYKSRNLDDESKIAFSTV